MMTLRRFRTLAASYGADLQRWPERLRGQALALFESSAEACAAIARARQLDEAIAAAGAARDEQVWAGESAERALHRVQSRVSARTRSAISGARGAAQVVELTPASSAPPSPASSRRAPRHSPPQRAGWFGLATAAGLAILAGLALGILYSPSAPPQDLTALLQPTPLQLLTD